MTTLTDDQLEQARPERLALTVLSPKLFRDRAAVRTYVAGTHFKALFRMVQWTIPDEGPGISGTKSARWAAYELTEDLLALAQAAASSDDRDLDVCDGITHTITQRVSFLSVLRAQAEAGEMVEELLTAVDDALEAIEEEECALSAKAEEALRHFERLVAELGPEILGERALYALADPYITLEATLERGEP